MPRIELATPIKAPRDRVFDLARSIDLHLDSVASSREQAVAGVTSGLIGMGQEVTWRAHHFGAWRELTVRITVFERPGHFRDSMVQGDFGRFDHDHYFEEAGGTTRMRDVFDFSAPGGRLSRMAEGFLLKAYLRRLLEQRAQEVRAAAKSSRWQKYLSPSPP